MANVRSSSNQEVQVAVEATRGTGVPATKLLTAFTWTLGGKPVTKQFRGTGRQYDSASALLYTESSGKISGPGDFSEMVYPLSSLFGSGSPVLHAASVAAYDWTWTPPLTGSYASNAKSLTVEMGDVVDAEKYTFLVCTSFGYSINRKQEMTIDADAISQDFTDGITKTASPTRVAQYPIVGSQFNLYLDSTSAGIGTTQLIDPLKIDFKASDYYEGYYPINRATGNGSYTDIKDKAKKNEFSMTLQANAAAMALKSAYLGTGALCYVRVDGLGQMIENDQTVGVGAASAGTFTLTYKGQTTAAVAYNATAAAVQSALRLLSTIGTTGCSVSGTAPTWTVTFTGALANDTTLLTGSGAGLTGGALTITAAPVNAIFRHDMACFISNLDPFADEDGVYAVKYTLQVAEDTAWSTGTAQKILLTNLVQAL
jgi:hypothetical protein